MMVVVTGRAFVSAAMPIIRALLEHGRFLPADTIATAKALAAFSLGLPAYVLIKVLTPGFHARQDTRMPVRIAIASMLVNLAGNLILVWPLAHVGVGVATAIAAWINVALLWLTLRKRGHIQPDARLTQKTWRILLAAAAMGVALWFGNELVEDNLGDGLWRRVAILSALVASGGAVYALAIFATGAYRLSEIKSLVRPRKAV